MITVTFDHSDNIAANIKTFWFKPSQSVHYVAGQYTQLYLPHKNPDERGEKHFFTLSSSPTEALMSISTKFAERSSTFKLALRALKPGDQVSMAEPMGDFVLPKDVSRPLVFIAGGIGITPFRSITKWLSDTKQSPSIQLIYAVNKLEEMAFKQLLTNYSLVFIPIIKEPSANWQGQTGTINGDRIMNLTGKPDGKLFYLSGPKPMIAALVSDLKAQGVNSDQIVTDFFPGYTQF